MTGSCSVSLRLHIHRSHHLLCSDTFARSYASPPFRGGHRWSPSRVQGQGRLRLRPLACEVGSKIPVVARSQFNRMNSVNWKINSKNSENSVSRKSRDCTARESLFWILVSPRVGHCSSRRQRPSPRKGLVRGPLRPLLGAAE